VRSDVQIVLVDDEVWIGVVGRLFWSVCHERRRQRTARRRSPCPRRASLASGIFTDGVDVGVLGRPAVI